KASTTRYGRAKMPTNNPKWLRYNEKVRSSSSPVLNGLSAVLMTPPGFFRTLPGMVAQCAATRRENKALAVTKVVCLDLSRPPCLHDRRSPAACHHWDSARSFGTRSPRHRAH